GDVGLGCGFSGGFVLALLHFHLEQTRPQHIPGDGAVTVLRAVLLHLDHDVGRDVRETHRRLCLVDVLAARAARPHDVGTHIVLVDFDLDAVVHNWIDADAGKRRVAPRIGVERRYPYEAMHAAFALEPAIGVMALDQHGR